MTPYSLNADFPWLFEKIPQLQPHMHERKHSYCTGKKVLKKFYSLNSNCPRKTKTILRCRPQESFYSAQILKFKPPNLFLNSNYLRKTINSNYLRKTKTSLRCCPQKSFYSTQILEVQASKSLSTLSP